jgi:hypothetical protein
MKDVTIESVRQKPAAYRQMSGSGTFLFCTPSQWMIAAMSGLTVSGLSWPWYGQLSGWIGVGLFLMVATLVHMVFTCGLLVSFPHIAILITGLQYVLAAWLSFYYPSFNPKYNIGAQWPVYASFAGWVTAVVCLGWALPLWGLRRSSTQPSPVSARLLAELDMLFWIGMGSAVIGRWVNLGPLSFVLLLCANLRYLGALGRMMVSGRGWKWRICLTLALEVLSATGEGMFHTLLLWSAAVFALYMYKCKPGKITVLGYVCLGILVLPALQQAKFHLREKVWSDDSTRPSLVSFANVENAVELLKDLGGGLIKSATGDWDADFLGDIAVRYNQGWIINRVMQTVPSTEPYAKGETLLAAIKASILPRLFSPDKVRAGGQANMQRYAGVGLENATSMNLGYAGEMYANFGYWGGIAGCFFYALILGLMFRWVCKRAALNPLWWAFVPYVGLVGLKAEEGIAEVLNWVVKAAVVSAAIYFIFPAIRAALSEARRGDRRVMLRKRRFFQQRLYWEKPNLSSRDLGTSKTAIRAGLSEDRRRDRRVMPRKRRFFQQRLYWEKPNLSSRDLGTSKTAIRAGLSEDRRRDRRVMPRKWFGRQRIEVEKAGLSSRDLGTSKTPECE